MKLKIAVVVLVALAASCALAQSPPALYQHETALLQRINYERARHGLPALAIDWNMQPRARNWAAWMTHHRALRHSGGCAENIAMGYSSVEAVVSGWMRSPGHRRNILGNYRYTGIAAYQTSGGTIYWCQQFR